MEITFDHTKDKSNRARHDVSLADAALLDGDTLVVKPDTRRDYPELRHIGYGLLADRLYCAVIVQRGRRLTSSACAGHTAGRSRNMLRKRTW